MAVQFYFNLLGVSGVRAATVSNRSYLTFVDDRDKEFDNLIQRYDKALY